MGCLKRRVQPEDVIINCSKGVNIPTPKGHKWKEIRHDNTVSIILLEMPLFHMHKFSGHLALLLDGECSRQQQVHYAQPIIEIEGSKGLG